MSRFAAPTPEQLAREASTTEKSSQSNWSDAAAKHASLEWVVDFGAEVLRGAVTFEVIVKTEGTTAFVVDTASGLTIERAFVDNEEVAVTYGAPHAVFGTTASVPLARTTKGAQQDVRFEYRTAPECSAAQWLEPEQTAGKRRPYLFTQCQAIHARALLPCQDAPGAKFSWDAVVDAPAWATSLLSALHAPKGLPFQNRRCPTEPPPGFARSHWKQPVPTSSYLVAIVVAELESREVSPRCRVWSEPSVVEAAADEFAETEAFLEAAEDITGQEYLWGRYDLVCLAPSFPYGGMENPCLTFVTPTLLAGDRSLAGVVAHEIAHSWTGNLVTNATWEHFWLNEGWTRWLERKIKAKCSGKGRLLEDFDLAASLANLDGAVAHFREIGQGALTALVPPVDGIDPDDAFSLVPYEKGSALLHLIERTVGPTKFGVFVKAYIKRFRFKTVTSAAFKEFAFAELGARALEPIDWASWFHGPGGPPQTFDLDESLGKRATGLARAWKTGQAPAGGLDGWTTDEKLAFLDELGAGGEDGTGAALSLAQLDALDERYALTDVANAEIRSRWVKLLLAAGAPRGRALAVAFVTSQGRMKFVRPLYRALFKSPQPGAAALAVATFEAHHLFYHPICRKMVASDLGVALSALDDAPRAAAPPPRLLAVAVVGAFVLAAGLVLMRKR